MIITNATILAAFLRHPFVVDDATSLYMVEFFATDQVIDAWQDRDGAYPAWSPKPPAIRNANHEPITLVEELAPGSVVNLALHKARSTLVLDGVKVIKHVVADPFAEAA